jgi:hypothetical protein
VHLPGLSPAIGTHANGGTASSGDEDALWSDLDVVDHQAGG